MTRYDEPLASDGRGGPHPLAGVPQVALDAATKTLEDAVSDFQGIVWALDCRPDGDVRPVAEAVLAAGLAAIRVEKA